MLKEKSEIRIIYMGTPEFAVPGLEMLLQNNYQVVAVVTSPDKPKGRGLQLQPSPVKMCAQKYGIEVLQPEKMKDPSFLVKLQSFNADLQIVVAFRMLPEEVWKMPPLGTFNLHASLLPQYRGAAPIHWAIINGETETGVTTFFLKHAIDTGDIIISEKVPIQPDDVLGTMYDKLMHLGARVILETVKLIEANQVKPVPQILDGDLKTAPKISKEHCKIDWKKPAIQIHNLVRGLNPAPAAHCFINGRFIKILKGEAINIDIGVEFETDQKNYLHVRTEEGVFSVKELQPKGKKIMLIKEFLAGHRVKSVT